MRKNLHLLAVFLGLFFLPISCEKEQVLDSSDVTFSLEATTVGERSVAIVVRHNGSNRDRYCGFCLEGTSPNIESEIDLYVRENGGKNLYSSALSQRKKVVHIESLLPNTDYTYIVFGISEDGEIFGKPACLFFCTERSSVEFVLNPAWSLVYKGEVFYDNAYWTGVKLEISGDKEERCLAWILSEDEYAGYEEIGQLAIKTADLYRSSMKDLDESDLWADSEWIVHRPTSFLFKRDPGNYLVLAFGINANGSFTGHYAMSDPFHIDEYTPNPTYTQYYGNWKLTDASDESYDVSITKNIVNSSLLLTGICGSSYPIVLNVEEETGLLTIKIQTVRTGGTYEDSDGVYTADAILRGWYTTNRKTINMVTATQVAKGLMNESGAVEFVAGFNLSNVEVLESGMFFRLYKDGGSLRGYLTGSRLVFPIKLVRK